MNGYIHSTESFGSVDGTGRPFCYFLSRDVRCAASSATIRIPGICRWERNGVQMTFWRRRVRYKSYWKDGGGITVSGGEPLMQMDFMIELFRKAKEKGINTTIDTSGALFTRVEPFFSKFNELMKYTDLLLVDIKHIDDEQHKILTGRTNENILDMARYLSDIGKPVWDPARSGSGEK